MAHPILKVPSLPRVHTSNSIFIRAPKETIFDTVANLKAWPNILPHYRSISYYERGEHRNNVKMAATRSGIPVEWMSQQEIDRDKWEVRFRHLKGWTKGMFVVWTFKEEPDGVFVEIIHDLNFRFPILSVVADRIIGGFFVKHIADQTLAAMKKHLEK